MEKKTIIPRAYYIVAFTLTLLYTLFLSAIHDCDEVFNYWEPLHWMIYGYGLQTWEYSPSFSLRPYSLLLPFNLLAKSLNPILSKGAIFQVIKVLICWANVGAFGRLCEAVGRSWDRHESIARIAFLLFVLLPGSLQASVAFLPNTISMILVSLAWSYYVEGADLRASLLTIITFLVTWPYAIAALFIPSLTTLKRELTVKGEKSDTYHKIDIKKISWSLWIEVLIRRWFISSLFGLFYLLLPTLLVDHYFYGGKWTITNSNALIYNLIYSRSHFYGVESPLYYLKNLLLNFNLAIILLIPFGITLLLKGRRSASVADGGKLLLFKQQLSITVWINILLFSCMSHKEERFLYTIYPLLILALSFAINTLLSKNRSKILIVFFIGLISLLRVLAVNRNYAGPSTLLPLPPSNPNSSTLCLGQDSWHYFPSHFHLHSNDRIQFIKSPNHSTSTFNGQLPRYYQTDGEGKENVFNQFNQPSVDQWQVGLTGCDYFWGLEHEVTASYDHLTKVKCVDIVEQGSRDLRKYLYIPLLPPSTVKLCVYSLQ